MPHTTRARSRAVQNLLPNPADEGRVRQHAVDIGLSVYRPLSIPQQQRLDQRRGLPRAAPARRLGPALRRNPLRGASSVEVVHEYQRLRTRSRR